MSAGVPRVAAVYVPALDDYVLVGAHAAAPDRWVMLQVRPLGDVRAERMTDLVPVRTIDPGTGLLGAVTAAVREVFPSTTDPVTEQVRADFADQLATAVAVQLAAIGVPPPAAGDPAHDAGRGQAADDGARVGAAAAGAAAVGSGGVGERPSEDVGARPRRRAGVVPCSVASCTCPPGPCTRPTRGAP